MDAKEINRLDRGQSLVLVAVMLLVLMGIMVLVIDGGMAYTQRRNAQNAADAAALAGAQEYCAGRTSNIDGMVREYSINRNDVTSYHYTTGSDGLTVVVTDTYDTFLARILNHPTMTVNATATAGCMSPCEATGFLPVAWSCRPSITSTVTISNPTQCVAQTGTLATPGPLYIFLDSESISNDCISNGGTINCDLDPSVPGDEVFTGGNRGLLNLNQSLTSCGESSIVGWIEGVNIPLLKIHTWLGKCEGNKTPTYNALEGLINATPRKNVVIIPVYDEDCMGDPRDPANLCSTHPPTDTYTIKTGGNDLNYHIIDYSVIKITCVQEGNGGGKKIAYDPIVPLVNGDCKARSVYVDKNKDNKAINPSSLMTAEGYFVNDFDPRFTGACGPSGPNSGAYTVYLK